jgi:hypothetical protein
MTTNNPGAGGGGLRNQQTLAVAYRGTQGRGA